MKDTAQTGRSQKAAGDPAAPDDAALMVLFANGDARAAQELTHRLGPKTYSVALRMLGDRAEAEDVAQEAMMRLWRIAPDWQSGQSKVSTWLYRVTMNLCLDRKRKQRPVDLEDVPEPQDPGLAASDRLQQAARNDALQAALMQLPGRQRQAVVLRHIEELSNPEIAQIMGAGIEAVESLTARGKRALAKILAEQKEELGYRDD